MKTSGSQKAIKADLTNETIIKLEFFLFFCIPRVKALRKNVYIVVRDG